MTTQVLGVPTDITWRRLAYSRDMIDSSFGELTLPPRWRSSLTVFSYVVPVDETAEAYPDSRIVYLRLACSVTGWNPSEELRSVVELDEVGDELDDLQHSTWQAIRSEGWAEQLWPCLGAIVQLAVYPSSEDEVGPDEFPFVVNVEPKKRELYETRSETGEVVSGSSDKINLLKGATTTETTEQTHIVSGSVGFSAGPFGASGSYQYSTRNNEGREAVEQMTTDTSRERRETQSHTTSFSQMYQLLNAYHVGTNRTVFALVPRPHIVTSQDAHQMDLNLLDRRGLTGLQDFLVVVEVPRSLGGLCVQASLDTGHVVKERLGVMKMRRDDDFDPPIDIPDYDPPPDPPVDDPLPPVDEEEEVLERLVVTRRVVRNCATFTEDDLLLPVGGATPDPDRVPVVGEFRIPEGLPERVLARADGGLAPDRIRRAVADQRNRFTRRVGDELMRGFTAGSYRPREFSETVTARSLTHRTLRRSRRHLRTLAEEGLITSDELHALGRLETVGELFTPGPVLGTAESHRVRLGVQTRLVEHVLRPARG